MVILDKKHAAISGEGSKKLRFYIKIRQKFENEKYLDILRNNSRFNMTRLRLSCHKLQIELGRHTQPKTVIDQRKCDVCNCIEDEIHFLLHYRRFETQKDILLFSVSLPTLT